MTKDEKQTMRKSFAGKKVSQMSLAEREVHDEYFQYGFGSPPIKNIENSILESNLGINPQVDGALIRLPIPKLSEERRNEITKIASHYAENSKISIRNIRREANDELKNLVKSKEISEDDEKKNEKKVQAFTDDHIKIIDQKVEVKEKEIMTI